MTTAKNLIRKTFRNRWALAALGLAVAVGVAYLVWGDKILPPLLGALIGLGIPAFFGSSSGRGSNEGFAAPRKSDAFANDDFLAYPTDLVGSAGLPSDGMTDGRIDDNA